MGGDARALKIPSWLTGIYFVIELGIGIYTGSVAVLSDSFHTFSGGRGHCPRPGGKPNSRTAC